jgi:hypothetical protein
MTSRLPLAAALLLGLTFGLKAQHSPGAGFGSAASPSLLRLAPLAVRPVTGVHLAGDLATVGRRSHHGKKEAAALMIVGGAGLVTGLIVDEPVITIAGAGVAGFGLYLYLR